jgi:hypothetical protein
LRNGRQRRRQTSRGEASLGNTYDQRMAYDEKIVGYAKLQIGREHGLDEAASRRLAGSTADELHADANAMAREVGAYDPTERARDEGGRFTNADGKIDVNQLIRAATGRIA